MNADARNHERRRLHTQDATRAIVNRESRTCESRRTPTRSAQRHTSADTEPSTHAERRAP
eukprot:5387975-Pleurochrysis_carterae.AAC.2